MRKDTQAADVLSGDYELMIKYTVLQ